MWQCVAVCCSVLQRVALRVSHFCARPEAEAPVLQCFAVFCSFVQRVALCVGDFCVRPEAVREEPVW